MAQRDHLDDAPVHGAAHAPPFHRREFLHRQQRHLLVLGGLEDRDRERVLGALLHRCGPLEHLGRRDRRAVGLLGGDDVGDRRLPLGDGPRLVEEHRADAAEPLQRLAPADQDPVLGRLAGPDEDRGGGREAQRAGAGDDEHRDERDGREDHRGRRPEVEPHDERGERHDQDDRHEHAGDAIRQSLDRRFAGLGVLHHADDLAKRRVLADARGAERDAAGGVDGAADDFVAGFLGDRHRLPGEHRLVQGRRPFGHDAVHGNALARLDDHRVAHLHRLDGDVGLFAVAAHVGQLGPEPGEPANRFGGTALGAGLQQTAEEDQGDDRRDGFVIDVRGEPGPREQPGDERGDEGVQVRRAGADADEGVHVGGAVPEAAPSPPVELPARPGDDGERQDREADLHPGEVERPPLCGDPIAQPRGGGHQQTAQEVELLERPHRPVRHEQHRAGHGEHRDDGRNRELPGQLADLACPRDALALDRVLGGDRRRDAEAGGLDRALQRLGGGDARHVLHRDGLGGLIRRDLQHAGDAGQLLLQRRDAGRVMQVGDAEGDGRLAAVVPGGAHGLHELGDVGLRVVVIHGRAGGGVVDGGLCHAAHPLQCFLHRGGARGAAHPLDGEDDTGFSHGTCAVRRRPGGPLRRVPRRAGL